MVAFSSMLLVTLVDRDMLFSIGCGVDAVVGVSATAPK